MASIRYTVCDRCGKKIDVTYYFLAKVRKPKKFSVNLVCRKARVFDTEYNYELCKKCGEAVQAFICAKPTEKEGAE